jgi:alpha-2-macroglobulin
MRRNVRAVIDRLVCVWAAAAIATGGCRGAQVTTPRSVSSDPATPALPSPPGGRPQIAIAANSRLGALAVTTADTHVATAPAQIAMLSERETAALHARMEPLPDLAAQAGRAPVLRPPTPAPPRRGPVQPIAFMVPSGKQVSDAPIAPTKVTAPLSPPEISPRGAVPAESEIRVRFSESMVPVAAVGPVTRPVAEIAPAVAGTWRWIDTRVATFTASTPRLPMATEFAVTVRAGTKATSGATLAEDTRTTFATPPIAIAGGYPRVGLRPDSAIIVQLDQDFDRDALLPFLQVTDAGGKRVLPHQVITLAEARARWAKNPAIGFDPTKADALLGRHHAILAPKTAWPAGTTIQVVLRAGAPSREGPRRSQRESYVRFSIVPPFTATGITCGDLDTPRRAGARCPALSYMGVHFSTPIAESSYRSSKVQIVGEPFEDHRSYGTSVTVYAPEPVGRTYTIAIGDGLVDIHGQPLIGPRALSFVTTPYVFHSFLEAPSGVHVLDPRFEIPQWIVHAEAVPSVRVRLYRVQPKDFFAYENYEIEPRGKLPGTLVHDRTYTVGSRHGAELRIDLRPALGAAGLGHVVALAEVPGGARRASPALAWIQVSRLGVASRIDGERVSAWVQDITPEPHFLAPIAGAAASLLVEGLGEAARATTDAAGHAAFELAPRSDPPRPRSALLLASRGDDVVFARLDRHARAVRHHDALWYATDDRFTYKPGEQVYVKGWVRWTHDGVAPDLALPRPGETVAYVVHDARGTKLGSGSAELSAQGGFHFELALPTTANLGTAMVRLTTRGDSHLHPISIQEFRTPAFQVTLDDDVTHGGALPLVLGERIEMATTARYYAGGGLPGASIDWAVTLSPGWYVPPGWSHFRFESPRDGHGSAVRWDQTGSLASTSSAAIAIGIPSLPDGMPSFLSVDATVTDVDRMAILATSRPILVHPSTRYVGLRLRPGTVDVLEAIVTDIDGNAIAGVPVAIELTAVLGSERGRADAKTVDTQQCTLTSGAAPVACPFTRRDTKYAYTARATVHDTRGRSHTARLAVPWWSYEGRRDFAIVPDKQSYRPGEIAKLEIQSAVFPATGVVTFARQGILAQRRIELAGPTTTVELPIEVGHVQNVHVVVDRYARRAATSGPATLPPLPVEHQVAIDLPVDVEGMRLSVRARPTRPLVEPGAEATFVVEVAHEGSPVPGAEVALMVVDEAVLALSARSHADPLVAFYRRVGNGTVAASTLGLVHDSGESLDGAPGVRRFALDAHSLTGTGVGYGSGAGGFGMRGSGAGGGGASVVTARKDFRATAVFSPTLTTDEHGRARLTVRMPDSLTRFRVVALATARDRYFGKGEGTIVTQRTVNARTVAPRFLSQGDTFSLPVVVQNLGSAARTIELAVRAANLESVGPAGKRVVVAGGQRAEVRFDFATRARGKAVIQTIAVSGDFADASTLELPVYVPATTETFATYGTVDDAPAFERLVVPDDVFAEVGGVEVELASTQLASLTDAYWYLHAYPYECAEQRSSRMLATAAMADVLAAFEAPGRPTRAELVAQRSADAGVLAREQKPDGGWGYFRGTDSDPFVTQQVLSALAAHGIKDAVTRRAIGYVERRLATLLEQLGKAAALPAAQRGDRVDHPMWVALAAAQLTALGAAGQDVRPRAQRLHQLATALDAYPIDAKARLLALVARSERARAMRDKLLAEVLSATHETAAAATVTAQYALSERLLLVSNTKTSALVLDALLREAPDHPLVTKLARGVLDGRAHGRWRSTQENLVALQALRRYFDVHEKVTPSYTGKLWFGSAAYTEQAFVGRSSTRGRAVLDWTTLRPGTSHDLALVKDGAGRMYYRVGITYAPKRLDVPALDAGFIVRRSYRAVDDPGDVVETPRGYRIRLGAKVLVTLEAINTTTRHAVALVDPIPAGLEPVNENLAIAERAVRVSGDAHWDHVNIRDDRIEAFEMQLAAGSHRFSYTARATTPGTFGAAPTKAEEMYSPESFGRSRGLVVTVE